MLDLDAIFDPDRPLPAWSVGPKPSTPVAPDSEIRVEDLDPDWRVEWEERSAIMEYDGGLPRERAEALALAEIVREMERVGVSLRDHA